MRCLPVIADYVSGGQHGRCRLLAVFQLQTLYQRRFPLDQYGAAIVRAIGAPVKHQHLVTQAQRAFLEPVTVTADRVGPQRPLGARGLGVQGLDRQPGVTFAIVEDQIKQPDGHHRLLQQKGRPVAGQVAVTNPLQITMGAAVAASPGICCRTCQCAKRYIVLGYIFVQHMLAIGGDRLLKVPFGHPGRSAMLVLQAGVFAVAVHMGAAVRELDQPERTVCADIMLDGAKAAFDPWAVGGHSIVISQPPAAKRGGVTADDLATGIPLRQ